MKKLIIDFYKYPNLKGSSKSATNDILKMTIELLESSKLNEEEILNIQNIYFGKLKDTFYIYRNKQDFLVEELGVVIRKLEQEKQNIIKKLSTKL